MGLFTFFSAVCVVLHMIGTILTGEVGGLLKSVIECQYSEGDLSCMCCDSIMTCKQNVPTYKFEGVEDCTIVTGLLKELMYGLCVLNIFGSLVCFIATILGCTSVARQAGRDQPLFRRRFSTRSDSHEHTQYSWLPYPTDLNMLPPYAPPVYRSVDNFQDFGATPYIVPPPVFDPTDLPPPYRSRDASMTGSGMSLSNHYEHQPRNSNGDRDRDGGAGSTAACVVVTHGNAEAHQYENEYQQRMVDEESRSRSCSSNSGSATSAVFTNDRIRTLFYQNSNEIPTDNRIIHIDSRSPSTVCEETGNECTLQHCSLQCRGRSHLNSSSQSQEFEAAAVIENPRCSPPVDGDCISKVKRPCSHLSQTDANQSNDTRDTRSSTENVTITDSCSAQNGNSDDKQRQNTNNDNIQITEKEKSSLILNKQLCKENLEKNSSQRISIGNSSLTHIENNESPAEQNAGENNEFGHSASDNSSGTIDCQMNDENVATERHLDCDSTESKLSLKDQYRDARQDDNNVSGIKEGNSAGKVSTGLSANVAVLSDCHASDTENAAGKEELLKNMGSQRITGTPDSQKVTFRPDEYQANEPNCVGVCSEIAVLSVHKDENANCTINTEISAERIGRSDDDGFLRNAAAHDCSGNTKTPVGDGNDTVKNQELQSKVVIEDNCSLMKYDGSVRINSEMREFPTLFGKLNATASGMKVIEKLDSDQSKCASSVGTVDGKTNTADGSSLCSVKQEKAVGRSSGSFGQRAKPCGPVRRNCSAKRPASDACLASMTKPPPNIELPLEIREVGYGFLDVPRHSKVKTKESKKKDTYSLKSSKAKEHHDLIKSRGPNPRPQQRNNETVKNHHVNVYNDKSHRRERDIRGVCRTADKARSRGTLETTTLKRETMLPAGRHHFTLTAHKGNKEGASRNSAAIEKDFLKSKRSKSAQSTLVHPKHPSDGYRQQSHISSMHSSLQSMVLPPRNGNETVV